MSAAASLVIDWSEQGYMQDAVIRTGIRGLLPERLIEPRFGDLSDRRGEERKAHA